MKTLPETTHGNVMYRIDSIGLWPLGEGEIAVSDGFKIDVPRVEKMIRQLDECTERMEDARTRLKRVGPTALGTEDLDDACDTFQSEWEDGITRIHKSASKIRDGLQTTLDAYKAGEEENAKNFGQG